MSEQKIKPGDLYKKITVAGREFEIQSKEVMSTGITSFDIFVNPIAKIKRTCYNDANGNAQFPIDKEVLL